MRPAFVGPNARLVVEALRSLADVPDAELALLFVTHSIPDAMDETSGPGDGEGRLYQEQHHALAGRVVDQVRHELGRDLSPEVVYCSRSGPPSQPWLEPDVNDRLEELAAAGRRVVVLAPVGFVSDHMEVVYDLDTEAAETAERLGLQLVRVPTVGIDEAFVAGLVDLLAGTRRGGPGRGGPVGTGRPSLGVPRGLLPEPATGPPGPLWERLMTTDVPAGIDLAALEDLATRLAVAAGRMIVDERPRLVEASATKSSPTDIVTIMDTRAEDLIRGLVLAERPDDAILGEEGDDQRGTSGITWVVDPIDGTVNYLYDIPAYAVSLAAATGNPKVPGEWQVLAGAVADPALGRVYHAAAGSGAYEHGWDEPTQAPGRTRLAVGSVDALSGALVGTGFGYLPEGRRKQGEMLLEVLPQVRDIRRIGSAALDLCSVACGRLDGFYEAGLNPWDMAAGWLIITEAGGVLTGPQGGPPASAMTVAGNPRVQAQLLAVLDGLG